MEESRVLTLLKAVEVYLTKIEASRHSDAMCETVFYDEANCDGYCLLADITACLDEYRDLSTEQERLISESRQKVDITIDKDASINAIDYDCDRFKAGYAKGLSDAWIDPAVKTPDDEQTVFFYDKRGVYRVGWYRAEDQDFDCHYYYVDLVDVLRWQPCVKPKGVSK